VKVLILNQCFSPDVVSSAQHASDLAAGLAKHGHAVTVLASCRGYDDPTVKFPRCEMWRGVTVIRIPCSGFGKQAKWRRAFDFATFMVMCFARLVRLPKFDVVVAMTSPPLICLLARLFVRIKGGACILWILDLNPDEAVAAGWLRAGSMTWKALDAMLRFSLRAADAIIVLDRFMEQRLMRKGIPESRLLVIPPWSHNHAVQYDHQGRLEFRAQHGLTEKYVVMYSGNHSPCHSLDTLLEAAGRLADHPEIVFCFVGGGSEFRKPATFARDRRLTNIRCLPYQPLDRLAASLSAADCHVLVMGNEFVGILHPCKVYNVLAVRAPFLYIGPPESHIADIISQIGAGPHAVGAAQGDVEGVVRHILQGVKRVAPSRRLPGLAQQFSSDVWLPKLIDAIESASKDKNVARLPELAAAPAPAASERGRLW